MEQPHTNLLHSIPFSESNGCMYWLLVIEKKSVNCDCFEYNLEFEKRKIEALLYALSSALNQQLRPISLTNRWVNRCIPRYEERAFYNNGF